METHRCVNEKCWHKQVRHGVLQQSFVKSTILYCGCLEFQAQALAGDMASCVPSLDDAVPEEQCDLDQQCVDVMWELLQKWLHQDRCCTLKVANLLAMGPRLLSSPKRKAAIKKAQMTKAANRAAQQKAVNVPC
eukprot:546833-Amphidinium_carterae.1